MSDSELRFSNKAGEEYDLFSHVLPHQMEMQRKCAGILKNHFSSSVKNIAVLEIGFGTGLTSHEILSVDDRVHLVAIDSEPKMLVKTEKKLESFASSRFELFTSEAFEYLKSLTDESFDAVITVWVLHNLQNDFRQKVLKEIYRVLKKGGVFINGDKIAVTNAKEHKDHLDWQLAHFDTFVKMGRPELKKEWTDHYMEDEDPDRILFEESYTADLKALNFKKVEITGRHFLDAISVAVK